MAYNIGRYQRMLDHTFVEPCPVTDRVPTETIASGAVLLTFRMSDSRDESDLVQ